MKVNEEVTKTVILISTSDQQQISKQQDSSQNIWLVPQDSTFIVFREKLPVAERNNLIFYVSCLEERFASVMAIPHPLSLRKTGQTIPPMENLPASVRILLALTSVNQQMKQCLAKGLLSYLSSCDVNKDFLLKSCWANWGSHKIETHLCVCPGMQSWLQYNHNHNHINTTCHLRVHLCSTLPLHVGRMLGRHDCWQKQQPHY